MNPIIAILWFLIFSKLLLFWLWLWQLKEYHLGRFKAHFEGQWFKKIISSFWRQKYPKFTKKIILIFLISLATEILLFFYFSFPRVIILTIFFIPLLVLSFQIPASIWRKIIINKAEAKRAEFKNLLVIGIAGSYGKTSTKEILATILSEKFKVLKTTEHQNSEVGISQCILDNLKPEHEIFVVEMGAYNRGGIELLCNIAKPKIGILTGINEQHLATFGSLEKIIKTKYELIENLPEDGTAFFNAKNKYCLELYEQTRIKKNLYGEEAAFSGGENVLGAIAVAGELGMSGEEISRAVEKIENKMPGIQIKKGINGLIIIDATYSANPDGVLAHLEYFKKNPGNKIIVMPCLIELGKAAEKVHKKIGQKIGEVCDLAIITTKDKFEEIKKGAPDALFMENPREIFEKIKFFCREGDMVLLESRVPSELIDLLLK